MSIKETALSRRFDWQMDCPNWEKFITLLADYFADYIAAILYLQTNTWKDTAEGVWLDRVGEIVGVTRPAEEIVERIFRCRSHSDPAYDELHGFGTHSNPSLGGLLWGRNGIPTVNQASGEDFLDFINAKIAATNADASVPGLAKFIRNAFGIECVITTGERQVFIELSGVIDLRQRRYLQTFIPVVAGVSCILTNWPDWGA